MLYYRLKPETCGWFGRKTLYAGELEDHPPTIYRMDFDFKNWPQDELTEVACHYIGTAGLAELINSLSPRVTGLFFGNVTINTTYEMRKERPNVTLPAYWWLKVNGKAGVDDFGMSKDHCLVVSERALLVMKPKIEHCQAEIYASDQTPSKQ